MHRFLKLSCDLNRNPLCADRDLDCCNGLCDNECEKVKFLLPIMEEMKKDDISNDTHTKKTNSFFISQALKFPFIFEQLFSAYSIILIIVRSREI